MQASSLAIYPTATVMEKRTQTCSKRNGHTVVLHTHLNHPSFILRFGAGNRAGVFFDVLFLVHPGSADQIPVILTVCSREVFKSQERAAQEPCRELAARSTVQVVCELAGWLLLGALVWVERSSSNDLGKTLTSSGRTNLYSRSGFFLIK